ncbi:hypothetical protein J4731_23545 [Providencia rettgeri]|nr:hypothetical protein [Providencia rettgeri]
MNNDNFNLALALKIHSYINYGMIFHGALNDLAKIVGIIRSGLNENISYEAKNISLFSTSLAQTVNEGVTVLFNGTLVGFDIYELTYAKMNLIRLYLVHNLLLTLRVLSQEDSV